MIYAKYLVARDKVNLFVAQYVHKYDLDFAKLKLGTGIYFYDGLKGNTPIFGKSEGNTVVNGLYVNDYHMLEGFGEFDFKGVLGMPLQAAFGIVHNFGADDNNFGYDLGLQLGKAKNVGDWQVKYSYTVLEKDATFGAYCDADNFGGGTAGSGQAIRAKYKMAKNIYLEGNFFLGRLDASKSKVAVEADYERVQLDVIMSF